MKSNFKLKETVDSAISLIKSLPSSQKKAMKQEFNNIYHGIISASESWQNLKSTLQLEENVDLEDAFINLGDLISIPRRGSSNILRNAYEEDQKDESSALTDFLIYQSSIKEEVYQLLGEIE